MLNRHLSRLAPALLASALVLTGCAQTPAAAPTTAASSAPADFLANHGLAEMTGEQIVDQLDRQPVADRPGDLMASVRPAELALSSGGEETAVDLPAHSFYLSIAPFVSQTHDCFYHSLTTCRGELGNADVHVTITDESGKVLVDEDTTTFDNGFVGYWVPSDSTGTVEITSEGRTGTAPFEATDEGATCLTNLQLR